jgi:hypothetical protein
MSNHDHYHNPTPPPKPVANHSLNSHSSTVRDAEIPLLNPSACSKPLIFWKAVVFDFLQFFLLSYLAPTHSHNTLFSAVMSSSGTRFPLLSSDVCIAEDNNPFLRFFMGMMNQFMRDSMAKGSFPAPWQQILRLPLVRQPPWF